MAKKKNTPDDEVETTTDEVETETEGQEEPKPAPTPKSPEPAPEPEVVPVTYERTGFIRLGDRVVNLAHVVDISMPRPGDKHQGMKVTLSNGANVSVSGRNSVALMKALGPCCEDHCSHH